MTSELTDPRRQVREVVTALVRLSSGELGPPVIGMVPGNVITPIKMYNLMVGESREIKEALNTQLSLIGWTAQISEEKVDDLGQVCRYAILKLLCADGTVYRSGSRGIAECLGLLTVERGIGPWQPPEFVTPRARSVSGNQQWYWLERVETAPKGKR